MAEPTSLNQAWGALRVVLRDAFTFYEIKDLVGLAGIDVTRLARLEQKAGGGASKGQLITALDREIARLDRAKKSRLLNHLAEEVVRQRPHQSESLNDYLERLGGKLVPIDVFDIAELADLPDVSRTDLLKAAARLRDGDLSGALGAACAAVDSATNAVYAKHGLSPPSKDAFQTRCTKALKSKKAISRLPGELTGMGWTGPAADKLSKNLQGALNQGAYVMQALRSGMSDVHGSKRVLNPLVYDSLKWAALIVRMLK
jgi:hypothetical protein